MHIIIYWLGTYMSNKIKVEEVSVIKIVVKDLNNKRNLIGQNGLKSLDKMA